MNEQQLIALAARGDNQSILKLANQYLPVVWKLRRQFYLRQFDEEDWKQEARIAIHRAAQQYDNQNNCSFGAFYKLVLNNQIIDLLRRSRAKKRCPEQELLSLDASDEELIGQFAVLVVSPLDVVYVHQQLAAFADLCSTFEGEVFAALLQGLSPQAIAQLLQVELNPVLNAMDRCRRKLRQLLTPVSTN
ncbi:sigma-70 family RNA polymerase sigma factor [Lactiplantibacillus modestisalitolerans]|uniref:Sigma-70 family RNA polymerase sigma factor n=1 Tax=Lactiplantibacillus modestisalitolerans TaxID=1457219 RepID=A0ABV5WQ52_9LACO|nr:sigma-70 family RNA polymerase sigma factor [Lactiplantibacillus modestisalitolerans]